MECCVPRIASAVLRVGGLHVGKPKGYKCLHAANAMASQNSVALARIT